MPAHESFRGASATLVLSLLLALCLPSAFSQSPSIFHDPVRVVPVGQSIGMIANVEGNGQAISEVSLHVTTSSDAIPQKIPMTPRGAGAFFGTIPAYLTRNPGTLRYYIEARTPTDFSETPFYGVQVSNVTEEEAPVRSTPVVIPPPTIPNTRTYPEPDWRPTTTPTPAPPTYPPSSYPAPTPVPTPPPVITPPQPTPTPVPPPQQEAKQKNWKVPAIIAAGAIAIGAAILIGGGSDDSGDDGGNDTNTTTEPVASTPAPTTTPTTTVPDTGTGTEPVEEDPNPGTREVITQAANDSVNSSIVDFPVQTTIDATSRFLGRTLQSTSINLSFNPEDTRAERFVVFFDNNMVLDTGVVTTAGNANVVVPGGTGIVTISVPSSVRNNQLAHRWSWAASIAYVVE